MMALYIGLVRDIQKGHREVKGQSLIAKYAVLFIMVVQYMTLQGMFQVVTYAGMFMAIMSIYLYPRTSQEGQQQMVNESKTVSDQFSPQVKDQ